MARLQKKCFLMSLGLHLGLLLVLVFGPAFRTPPERPPRISQISLMSSAALEAALARAEAAQSPVTVPPVEPEPEPEPEPTRPEPEVVVPPQPVVEKPKPEPIKKPDPPKPKPVEQPKKPVPEPPKPKPKPKKPKPEVKINFNRTQQKADPARAQREAERRREQEERERQRRENEDYQRKMSQSLKALGNNLNQRSDIDTAIVGGGALGNYAAFVRKAYNSAWVAPAGAATSRAVTRVSVTVALDGTVSAKQIVRRSGQAVLDQSVEDALKRVKRINRRPPAETTTAERTFIINFNLKDGLISG